MRVGLLYMSVTDNCHTLTDVAAIHLTVVKENKRDALEVVQHKMTHTSQL